MLEKEVKDWGQLHKDLHNPDFRTTQRRQEREEMLRRIKQIDSSGGTGLGEPGIDFSPMKSKRKELRSLRQKYCDREEKKEERLRDTDMIAELEEMLEDWSQRHQYLNKSEFRTP